MLTLEPERLKNQPTTTRERIGGDGRALPRRRSSGLRFQFFSVEVFSLLPQSQRNGCNLARQCETGHGGLDAFSQRSLVEILEWSGLHTGPGGGSFEQAFQIMVVILVEAANGDLLFRASQLAVDIAVFSARASLSNASPL